MVIFLNCPSTKALSSFVVEGDFDFQRLYEVTKVVTRNLNKAVSLIPSWCLELRLLCFLGNKFMGLESLLLYRHVFFWAFGRIVEVGSGILVLYRSILVSYLAFSLEAHHRVRRFADRSLIEIIIQWYLGSKKIGQDWIHGGFVIRT